MEHTLRVQDGREVPLGSEQEVTDALADIMDATGGSSHRGQFSSLFGGPGDDMLSAEEADRLGQEAAEFLAMYGDRLRKPTITLLDRLSSLGSSPPTAS
jgi:hypothetical protein